MSVADPETSERGGGARNMKYKPAYPRSIFLAYFYRPGRRPPWPALDPLLCVHVHIRIRSYHSRTYREVGPKMAPRGVVSRSLCGVFTDFLIG